MVAAPSAGTTGGEWTELEAGVIGLGLPLYAKPGVRHASNCLMCLVANIAPFI